MSRDQRAHDNWAAIYASQLAERQQVPYTEEQRGMYEKMNELAEQMNRDG
jgi:hypothetical protein